MKAEFRRGSASRAIHIEPEGALLDQALAQGLDIDFACRRGDCGQCTATVVDGVLHPVDADRPFKRGQEVYLCNAAARSDVVLRLPYAPETAHLRVLRSPCKIHELRRHSADVVEVVLRLPPTAGFDFVPGQYIRLTNKARVTRSYSLAEAPQSDKLLRIHVRRVLGGAFSEYLFSGAAAGDLLHLEGPMGRFVIRDDVQAKQTLFLATGTGIAPIHAILSGMTPQQRERCGAISCYWGNRTQADAYCHSQLERLAAEYQLRYFAIFSREAAADCRARHVQDLLAEHHATLAEAQVFASGNAAMTDSARQRCLALGLSEERFFSDPFTAS